MGGSEKLLLSGPFFFSKTMTTDYAAGAQSLGADINKVHTDVSQETKQGVVSEKLPELTLDMPDKDIVSLFDKRKKKWDESEAKKEWEEAGKENEKYWLGKQYAGPKPTDTRPNIDNVIFESVETYLPQVTRRNPEPTATLDASEDPHPTKDAFITKVKNRLGDLADKNKLRLKLKRGARYWAIYLLGVAKLGWDVNRNIPTVV